MKKLLIILAVVAGVLGALAIYLIATTQSRGVGIRLPLDARERALIAGVPADADWFAVLPSAASLRKKLEANRVSATFGERFTSSQKLPSSWMLGGADLVVWRQGKQTTYSLALDPFRALVARTYLSLAGGATSSNVLINVNPPAPSGDTSNDLEQIVSLANGLPPGDALVVQRDSNRSAFPPIGRPVVSSVHVAPVAIDIVSRAEARSDERPADLSRSDGQPVAPQSESRPLAPRFARGAIVSGVFVSPPRLLEEMNRLVGTKASSLLHDGGSVTVYEVDGGKLLPRPHEVIAVPATPQRREELQALTGQTLTRSLTQAAGFSVETGEANGDLLVAFDGDSIPKYRGDTFDEGRLPANVWAIRIDPQRAAPVLEQLSGNPALRYLAPRLFRSARDLGHWIEPLQQASSIEGALSSLPGIDELRVRITSK